MVISIHYSRITRTYPRIETSTPESDFDTHRPIHIYYLLLIRITNLTLLPSTLLLSPTFSLFSTLSFFLTPQRPYTHSLSPRHPSTLPRHSSTLAAADNCMIHMNYGQQPKSVLETYIGNTHLNSRHTSGTLFALVSTALWACRLGTHLPLPRLSASPSRTD